MFRLYNYLLKNKEKIYELVDILDWITNYINNDLYTILRLWRVDSLNFKDNLSILRKKMWLLLKHPKLNWSYKDDLIKRVEKLKEAYTNLIN